MSYTPRNPNGQATMANSEPVVLASDHSDLKITLDSEAVVLGAGTAAFGKLAANSGVDIGDVDVTSVPADPFGLNADAASATGSISAKLRFIASTGIPITGTVTVGSHAVTNAGTFAVQADGSIAHDGVDSGNPLKIGAKAIAHGTNPTAVAAADRTDLYSNRHGIQFTIGGHPNLISAEYITTAAQTDDNILPLISAGTIYVITSVTVSCSAANSVNTSVRLCMGTAIVSQGASGADATSKVILSHGGIAPGSGVVKGNGSGIVGIGGDGEELRIACSVPTGGNVIVQVDYYTISS